MPLAVVGLRERMPRAQVGLVESTMNQLMPQLARGELDIVVSRSDREHDDPQLQTATLYHEPKKLRRTARSPADGNGKSWLGRRPLVFMDGLATRHARTQTPRDSAHSSMAPPRPDHCVESSS